MDKDSVFDSIFQTFFHFHSALFLTSLVFDFDSLWHTNFMSSTARTLKLQLKPLSAGTTVTHTAS